MMPTIPLDLDGYTDLPHGRIANVVTYLEMRAPPAAAAARRADLALRRIETPDLAAYRALYSRIGHDWLWFSRAVMPDETLAAILADPATEVYFLMRGEEPVGLAELAVGTPEKDEVEIAYFGIVPELTGAGAGRFLMEETLKVAWRPGVARVWLHTCSFDAPAAIPFYQRLGFTPYKMAIEVSTDPRTDGFLPRTAGPHVALIEPGARG